MKNNLDKTEEILKKGKNVSLSASEREEMKALLLSYATYHRVKEAPAERKTFWFSVWTRGFAPASLALVLFFSTSYASTTSLPGDLLYPVKTNLIEELTAATKLTPISQLEYQHHRYETRLIELHTLSEQGKLSNAALKDYQIELLELSEEIEQLLDGEDKIDDLITAELVGDMLAMGNATEVVVRGSTTAEQRDDFEAITDTLEEIHTAEITDLLETSTSTIETFIQTQLSEISDELAEDDLNNTTTLQIENYLEDAEVSLQASDYSDVVTQVVDAFNLILTNEYSNDYIDEVNE